MITELSILIPVFNLDVRQLVTELHQQCQALPVRFEILLFDDASAAPIRKINRQLANLPHVTYLELPENIGRSAIRNKLAAAATYNYLLLLDNDCLPSGNNFVAAYLQAGVGEGLVVGGVAYQTAVPKQLYRLHWKYGQRAARPVSERVQAPYKNIYLSNVFVQKDLFLQFQLCETIKGYGHEDTLFALKLEQQGIPVKHIQNTVIHLGLETTAVFLSKTEQAVANLVVLFLKGEKLNTLKLVKAYRIISKTGLAGAFIRAIGSLNWVLKKNLASGNPSMLLFDLYRLYLFAVEMKNRKI